jgi:hypothetical protein
MERMMIGDDGHTLLGDNLRQYYHLTFVFAGVMGVLGIVLLLSGLDLSDIEPLAHQI